MHNRYAKWAGLAGLAGVVALAVWLLVWPGSQPPQQQPDGPAPIKTRIPELTALAAEVQAEAEAAAANYTPKLVGNVADLSLPAADILKQLPGVEQVETLVAVAKPAGRIVHLANYHTVPRELAVAEFEQMHKRHLTDAERDDLYRQLLLQVEIVQAEQLALLRCLVRHHGLKAVFLEGLTPDKASEWQDQLALLAKVDADLAEVEKQLRTVRQFLKTGIKEQADKAKGIESELLTIRWQQLPLLLEVGAPGRLLVRKEIGAVWPLDDAALLDDAKLVSPSGEIRFDAAKVKARQVGMVKAVKARGNFGLVVLGNSHDLAAVVREQAPGWEYVRVVVKHLPT
jgi:hypothetical protein